MVCRCMCAIPVSPQPWTPSFSLKGCELDTLLPSVGKDWLPVTHSHALPNSVTTTVAAKEVVGTSCSCGVTVAAPAMGAFGGGGEELKQEYQPHY